MSGCLTKIGSSIAEGGYGTVSTATYNGKSGYVVKTAKHGQIEWKEIACLSKMDGDGTIKLVGVDDKNCGKTAFGLVLPIASNTEHELENIDQVSIEQRESYSIDLISGLAKLHMNGILHCDMKPANTLIVTKNGKKHVVYSDFGGARVTNDLDKMFGEGFMVLDLLSSRAWMDPISFIKVSDDIRDGKIPVSIPQLASSKNDVYGLGFILLDFWGDFPTFGSIGYEFWTRERALRYAIWFNFFVSKGLLRAYNYMTVQLWTNIVKEAEEHELDEDPNNQAAFMFINKLSCYDHQGSLIKYIELAMQDRKDHRYKNFIEEMTRLKSSEADVKEWIPQELHEEWENYKIRPNSIDFVNVEKLPRVAKPVLMEGPTKEFTKLLKEITKEIFQFSPEETSSSISYRYGRAMSYFDTAGEKHDYRTVFFACVYLEMALCPYTEIDEEVVVYQSKFDKLGKYRHKKFQEYFGSYKVDFDSVKEIAKTLLTKIRDSLLDNPLFSNNLGSSNIFDQNLINTHLNID